MYKTAITASPWSYSKVCDTFRPRIGQVPTIGAFLGSKTLVHFLKPRAMLNSLVRQFVSEGRPAGIKNRLSQARFDKTGGVHITDRDVVAIAYDAGRQFMLEVVSTVGDLRVYRTNSPLLACTLSHSKRLLSTTIDALRLNFFTGRQGDKILQAQTDTNSAHRRPGCRGNHDVEHDVEEAVCATVLREVAAVFDLPIWKRPAVEDAEHVAGASERGALAFEFSALERNPSEMLAATVTQTETLLLCTRFGVLFANGIDATRVQPQLLAAPLGQLVQVETGMPAPPKSKRVLLPVITKVPDEIACPRLLVEQPGKRFDALTADQYHTVIMYSVFNRKTSTATQSAPFTPRPEGRGLSEQF